MVCLAADRESSAEVLRNDKKLEDSQENASDLKKKKK